MFVYLPTKQFDDDQVRIEIVIGVIWELLQPQDQHERLSLCFDRLMKDVTQSLDSKNRDQFSNNLIIFKKEICANWNQFSLDTL